MIYSARELQNYINSGLSLVGQDEDGSLEWMGSDEQWTRFTWLQDGVKLENTYV